MTLYFKRAKSFVTTTNNDHGEKKYLGIPGPTPAGNVPFWVAETTTFKLGIQDGSIINLTPPEQMPGYKPAPVAVVEEAETVASDDAAEQTEVPKVPFGGQPMTPVSPAPKVGKVRAASQR